VGKWTVLNVANIGIQDLKNVENASMNLEMNRIKLDTFDKNQSK